MEGIEAEFGPRRSSTSGTGWLHRAHRGPVLRQVARVYIDEGTHSPGFQFLPDGRLHPTVRVPARL